MRSSCARLLCVALVVLMALLVAGVGAAQTAGEVAPADGIQLACARCGLAEMVGARLQSTATATAATVQAAADGEIDLDDERIEISAVAAVSPKRTGTGGCVSYRVARNSSGSAAIWADVGVLRWDGDTLAFVGASTSIPLGTTLAKHSRIGAGILHDGQPLIYTRAAISF